MPNLHDFFFNPTENSGPANTSDSLEDTFKMGKLICISEEFQNRLLNVYTKDDIETPIKETFQGQVHVDSAQCRLDPRVLLGGADQPGFLIQRKLRSSAIGKFLPKASKLDLRDFMRRSV